MEDYEDVKQKIREALAKNPPKRNENVSNAPASVIQLSSSSSSSDSSSGSSDSDSDDDGQNGAVKRRMDASASTEKRKTKRQKPDNFEVVLPVGFLDPLTVQEPLREVVTNTATSVARLQSCKQFWKAGDYEGAPSGDWDFSSGGMDHVRVHPKFLHSNATSHKWALGAFAELLDNSLDEVSNGATYVNVDMVESRKDGSRMLLIEDNGGGMDPDKMRHCMSLGYSAKSKLANTIGQYGNGFKTSTMRLGADVIVFSRCYGKDGSPTQSIGLLSYTFLRSTGKEDIVVPMLDYERSGREWTKIIRSSPADWNRNMETITQWSPFSCEVDLLSQFNMMKDHGTRIIIYNLWDDDQGQLELDFDTDKHDIQLRGVNREEKNIEMAREFPNSRHFLTYRHSLRSYASILYLRLPPSFRIILRGKDVEHHNIVNDMMLSQEITYRPQPGADGVPKDFNIAAVVTVGFVKDAKFHIDVQGFNVYHKNRLIKPFWRLWNAAGSDGRGVIGVLEANFVEPAHDKQGFERTTVLARLEARLIQMQKTYWSTYCHRIGYAPRRNKKVINAYTDRETSPDYNPRGHSRSKKNSLSGSKGGSQKSHIRSNQRSQGNDSESFPETESGGYRNGHVSGKGNDGMKILTKYRNGASPSEPSSSFMEDVGEDDTHVAPERVVNDSNRKKYSTETVFGKDGLHRTRPSSCLDDTESQQASGGSSARPFMQPQAKVAEASYRDSDADLITVDQLKQENHILKERLEKKEEELLGERDRCKSLEAQLQEAQHKIEGLNKEQESLIDIFSEERDRREREEENLRKKIKDASNTIQELVDKIKLLEKIKSSSNRTGR
ncbi:hypothetical protein Dsin_030478 [Dipteronia sinensis]|uniref:Morc S5 domain-containing protein n=1 Tax=Dipteronia sinensis TaxID=43782 RepID=A0AAD9ZJD4_9ROSI|nr:hypothetical protein Dsin_030478 [Dipteronia sinensis]